MHAAATLDHYRKHIQTFNFSLISVEMGICPGIKMAGGFISMQYGCSNNNIANIIIHVAALAVVPSTIIQVQYLICPGINQPYPAVPCTC